MLFLSRLKILAVALLCSKQLAQKNSGRCTVLTSITKVSPAPESSTATPQTGKGIGPHAQTAFRQLEYRGRNKYEY